MRLHYLQHVPFEDAANIACWAADRGHALSRTLLYDGPVFPEHDAYDWLVVLGGPMNIDQETRHPWLVGEKDFIRDTVQRGKTVLGICLGAQLLSDVLGGRVSRNPVKEIGLFPVRLTPQAAESPVFRLLPDRLQAFHWHGDTLTIPPGALHCASSEACAHQAFHFGERVVAVQFHLEYDMPTIRRMIRHCPDDLEEGPFIQPLETLVGLSKPIGEMQKLLDRFLDGLLLLS